MEPGEGLAYPLGGVVVEKPVPAPAQPEPADHNRNSTARFSTVDFEDRSDSIVPAIGRRFDDVERHREARAAGGRPLEREGVRGVAVGAQMERPDGCVRKPSGSVEREHRPTVEITDWDDHDVFGINGRL